MKLILSKNPKIQGLLTKDMLHLKRFRRILASLILLFTIAAILQYTTIRSIWLVCLLPVIVTVGAGFFALSSFNHDENEKTDIYVKSLPLTAKEIVWSKYIFVIFLTVVGALIGLLLTSFIFTFFSRIAITTDFLDFLILSIASTFCVSLLESIQIPCIYKFGAEKAKMQIYSIIVALVVIVVLLVSGIFYWLDKLSLDIYSIAFFIPLILIGLTAIVYNFSYKISCKIYEKQE